MANYRSSGPATRCQVIADNSTVQQDDSLIVRLRRRFPWLDWAMAVNNRVSAIGGGPLASSLALATFLSLFPLLVVGIAVVGYLQADDVDFADQVVEDIGLEGEAADTVLDAIHAAERNRQATTVVGLGGLAWSGLAVVGSVEAALNATWQVKGRGFKAKPRAALWLGGVGAVFLASATGAHFITQLPGLGAVASVVAAYGLDVLLLLTMFHVLTNLSVPLSAHLPGALAGGAGLMVLKVISGVYLPRLVESSSLYGSIGVVFALLAWFMLLARLVVYAAAINVVTYERRFGTVTAEIDVPRVDGRVPLAANRGGAVDEAAEPAEPAAATRTP